MSNDQYGRTSLIYLKDKGEVTTYLNGESVHYKCASDLAITNTIIHESIHAYLTKLYYSDKSVIFENYPEMLNKFIKTHKKPANEVQHELFTKYFVEDIAKSLELFGISRGYQLKSSFYEDLAWGNLTGTNAFQNLDETSKTRIKGTVAAERYDNKVNTNGQTQKGAKIGC